MADGDYARGTAGAILNSLQYLDDNPTEMAKANKEWKASGIKERMLRENVDYLRERAEGKKAAPKEGAPKKSVSFNDLQKG